MKDANDELTNLSGLRKSTMDVQQKMASQFGKLDSLLTKAENAEYAMKKQTRDMKGLMK